jgi:eukaryotic-like serine/threonine-protein kinase
VQRRMNGCDANRLRLLLEENLEDPQQAEVVRHLDNCVDCQHTLEKLAADQRWWDGLRDMNHARDSSLAAPAVKISLGKTQEARLNGPARQDSDDVHLDFLDPPGDPAHLGRLGPFAITELLGRGGMGVVLKGFDAALNRPVAIKVLAPHFASSGAARKRFAREAQAAAAVVHEHVVAIHGVDTWKGLPYLVMSFVPGRSLQERIDREGPLQVKEILRIGMQAASGLAAAHTQGLVHRDVKPANILLENGVERVRLTDFGLARAVDDASLTQSGVVAGTPQYMAPEQARGEAIDHRVDLFSLGSTLYAMCTGHAPFRADSAMAVLRRICEDQPRPLRTINPDIPTWLVAIIEKLHTKQPSERFQTAAEVADLLGACLAHVEQPDTVPLPAAIGGLCSRRRRLRRGLRWLGAALVILATGLAGAFQWTSVSDQFWPTVDVAREAAAREDANAKPLRTIGEAGMEEQLDTIRGRMTAVEADLNQRSVAGYGDPAEAWLRDVARKLHALQRQLADKTGN